MAHDFTDFGVTSIPSRQCAGRETSLGQSHNTCGSS